MAKPILLTPAWGDLSSIADYLAGQAGPATSEKVVNAILDNIDLLENMPYLGPIHHDSVLQTKGYRKLVCSPYIVIYKIVDGQVYIYRIFRETQNYIERL